MPTQAGTPDSICVFIYTSGTTGFPKGVTHSQRNVRRAGEGGGERRRDLARLREIVGEAPRVHGLTDAAGAADYVAALLRQVGLDPALQDRYPHQFSGGMRQRVMIAMALACRPKVLIADEPTTALDVTIQGQILYEVQKLCRETGTSLIWITHDLSVVAGLAAGDAELPAAPRPGPGCSASRDPP